MSQPQSQDDELKAFLIVLRQGLLVIIRHIEKRYGLDDFRRDRAA